uniref:Uncharacterized protein n=1 Tax=Plectus sambesii TaxID=2011161 RepID=A0A914VPC5_9BILA
MLNGDTAATTLTLSRARRIERGGITHTKTSRGARISNNHRRQRYGASDHLALTAKTERDTRSGNERVSERRRSRSPSGAGGRRKRARSMAFVAEMRDTITGESLMEREREQAAL